MNLIVFFLDNIRPQFRAAVFSEKPQHHVFVATNHPGVTHETITPKFDSVELDIPASYLSGVKRIRLEVQSDGPPKKAEL